MQLDRPLPPLPRVRLATPVAALLATLALGLPGAAIAAPQVMPSGLVFESLKEGSGPGPGPESRVRVHYRGSFPDGKEFDSSFRRGRASEFPLDRVIPCWTEGLMRMKPGGKARLICPPAIAYGPEGRGPIPPNATLHFEVELLDVLR